LNNQPSSAGKREFLLNTLPEHRDLRLDVFIANSVENLSRSRIAKLIGEGHVLVDGNLPKASYKIRGHETVVVIIPEADPARTPAQNIPLDVLHEDDDIIVVNKPAGMVVHPAAGNPDRTLVNALLAHAHNLSGVGGVLRPGIVHRLDKGTSGAIVCAKNDFAHESLSRMFAERTVKKIYIALTLGAPNPAEGLIDLPIGRHKLHRKKMSVNESGGRESKTQYKLLSVRGPVGCVQCRLLTGRTHQIRVHLKALGCPLIMDDLYGGVRAAKKLPGTLGELAAKLTRPALHAFKLSFRHPRTNEWIDLTAPIPDDLAPIIASLGISL